MCVKQPVVIAIYFQCEHKTHTDADTFIQFHTKIVMYCKWEARTLTRWRLSAIEPMNNFVKKILKRSIEKTLRTILELNLFCMFQIVFYHFASFIFPKVVHYCDLNVSCINNHLGATMRSTSASSMIQNTFRLISIISGSYWRWI